MSPIRAVERPWSLAIWPACAAACCVVVPRSNTSMAVTVALSATAGSSRTRSRVRSVPEKIARVGDLLAVGSALDLEHRRRRRTGRGDVGRRQEPGDRPHEIVDTDAAQRRAEVHRQDVQTRGLLGDHPAQLAAGQRSIREEAAQDVVVVDSQGLRGPQRERRVGEVVDDDAGAARPDVPRDAHRQHVGAQTLRDRVQRAAVVRARSVDLVHEDDRRHAESSQRPVQQQRLGLHALDR